MDATKDSTGEPTSPNPTQFLAKFVKKHRTIQKTHMVLGMDYPKFVDHIFQDIMVKTIEMNHVSINK